MCDSCEHTKKITFFSVELPQIHTFFLKNVNFISTIVPTEKVLDSLEIVTELWKAGHIFYAGRMLASSSSNLKGHRE